MTEMTMTLRTSYLQKLYRDERYLGWRASQAVRNARTRAAWDAADGYCDDPDDEAPTAYRPGRVRLVLRPDDDPSSALDFDGSEAETAGSVPPAVIRAPCSNHPGGYYDG